MKSPDLEHATTALVAAASNVLAAAPLDNRDPEFSRRLGSLREAAWEARVAVTTARKVKRKAATE